MSALLNTKRLVLGVSGAAAFAAAYWFNKPAHPEVAVVQPVSRLTRSANPSKPPPHLSMASHSSLQTPGRDLISSANEKDAFSPHSWLPPPPPAPPAAKPLPPAAPAKPVPPPLPFVFFGTLDEKGTTQRVFLTKGDQLLVVKANDVVEGRYRIDQITESSVELTYLPLNQKQTISIQQGGT